VRHIGALRRPTTRSGRPLRDEFEALATAGLSPFAGSLGWSIPYYFPSTRISYSDGSYHW